MNRPKREIPVLLQRQGPIARPIQPVTHPSSQVDWKTNVALGELPSVPFGSAIGGSHHG